MKNLSRVGIGMAFGGGIGILGVISYLAWVDPSFRLLAAFILTAVLMMSGLLLWHWAETEISFQDTERRYKR